MKKYCYVCSYGGSGSKMLNSFLKRYYNSIHLHDGNPPKKLTIPGLFNKNKSDNTFGIREIDPNLVHVIFIFRSPVDAYLSRGENIAHCKNIDGDYENHISDKNEYVKNGVDILKYKNHFKNYTTNNGKNYNVICINYHKLWDNLEDVFNALDIPLSEIDKFPVRKETIKEVDDFVLKGLEEMYSDIIKDINNWPAVKII